MSLIVTAIVLSSALPENGAFTGPQSPKPLVTASQNPAESAGLASAQAWVALLDGQRWDDSWQTAAAMFKSQLTSAQWAKTVQPVRAPLGPVSSRVLDSATRSTSLPGAPAGEYEILQFRTSFANRRDAVETVILAREGATWKVAGYFIR